MIFNSERLEYTLFEESDTDAMMTFWGDEDVMAQCGGTATATEERFIRTARFYQELYTRKGFSVFAVVLKETGEIIGAAGFNPTDKDTEAELIYHFAKKYWGNGFATEAANACMNFIKSVSNLELVSASFTPGHLASKKVLESVGFECKGLKWFDDTNQNEPYYEYLLK